MVVILLFSLSTNNTNGCDESHTNDRYVVQRKPNIRFSSISSPSLCPAPPPPPPPPPPLAEPAPPSFRPLHQRKTEGGISGSYNRSKPEPLYSYPSRPKVSFIDHPKPISQRPRTSSIQNHSNNDDFNNRNLHTLHGDPLKSFNANQQKTPNQTCTECLNSCKSYTPFTIYESSIPNSKQKLQQQKQQKQKQQQEEQTTFYNQPKRFQTNYPTTNNGKYSSAFHSSYHENNGHVRPYQSTTKTTTTTRTKTKTPTPIKATITIPNSGSETIYKNDSNLKRSWLQNDLTANSSTHLHYNIGSNNTSRNITTPSSRQFNQSNNLNLTDHCGNNCSCIHCVLNKPPLPPQTSYRSYSPDNETHYVTRVNFYELNSSQVELNPKDELEAQDAEAITTEEEWVTKKKTELTTTKQIETRVKRELVFEDGKVVEDSGAIVSTNTTEDTDKKETQTTEKKDLGIPGPKVDGNIAPVTHTADPVTTLAHFKKQNENVDAKALLRESNLKKVVSHEVREDLLETEVVQHRGDFKDEDYVTAVNAGVEDLETYLQKKRPSKDLVAIQPKILNDATKTFKTIDSEDLTKLWVVQADGTVVTEKKKTTEFEVITDRDLPEEDDHSTGSQDKIITNSTTERYTKQKDVHFDDLVVDGKVENSDMRYSADTVNIEKHGSLERIGDWDSLSDRIRKQKRLQQKTLLQLQKDRKDALTKRPLNFDLEEETRKGETMKWLESHFGSESNTSMDSSFNDVEVKPTKKTYFNVTIKSQHADMPATNPPMVVEENGSALFDRYVSREDILNQKRKSLSGQNLNVPYRSTSNFKQDIYLTRDENIPGSRDSINRKVINFQGPSYPAEGQYTVGTLERPKVPQRRRHSKKAPNVQSNNNYPIQQETEKREVLEPFPDYSPILDASKNPRHIEKPTNRRLYDDEGTLHSNLSQKHRTRFTSLLDVGPESHRSEVTQKSYPEPAKPPKAPSKSNKVSQVIGRSFRKLVNKIRSASADRKLSKSRSKSLERTNPNYKNEESSETYQQYNVIDGHIAANGTLDNDEEYFVKNQKTYSPSQTDSMNILNSQKTLNKPENKSNIPRNRYFLGEDPYSNDRRDSRVERNHNESRLNQNKTFVSINGTPASNTLGRNLRYTRVTESMPHLNRAESLTSQTLPRKLHQQNYTKPATHYESKPNLTRYTSTIAYNPPPAASVNTYNAINKPVRSYVQPLNRSKSLNFNAFLEDEEISDSPHEIRSSNLHNNYVIPENQIVDSLKSPSIVNLISRSQRDLNKIEPTHVRSNISYNINSNGQEKNYKKTNQNSYYQRRRY